MQREDNPRSDKVNIIELPYLPARINIDDIKDWIIDPVASKLVLFWHTPQERNRLLAKYKNLPDDRYKEDPFDVIVYEGRVYALYQGVQKEKEAGAGSFGVVKYAIDLENGNLYAVKIFSTTHKSYKTKPPVQRTFETIVRCATEEFAELKKSYLFHGKKTLLHRVSQKKGQQLYFFMRLIPGIDLINYASFYKLSPRKWLMVARNICELVEAFHKSGKLHRDIKLDNIMIDPATLKLTLIDYSFVINMPNNPQGTVIGKPCGTPSYAAPEVKGGGLFSKKSEIYAAGVCIAKLFRVSRTDPKDLSSSLVPRGTPNSFIQGNQILIDKIITLCESMMHHVPSRRIDLYRIISAIRLLEASVQDPIKIAIVDVKELMALDQIQLELMSELLKDQDEVQLINTQPKINLDLLLKRIHPFQQAHISLQPTIYSGQDYHQVIVKLKNDMEERYPNVAKDYKLFDLSTLPVQRLYKKALLSKDINQINKYLQLGAQPDLHDLLMGVKSKNLSLVELLLAYNVNPNPADAILLPLVYACRNDVDSRFMQALLTKADPNLSLPSGNTPLIEAIHFYLQAKNHGDKNPSIEKIMILLINGALPNLAVGDRLPLHDAIKGGDEEIVKLLIMWGADPTFLDVKGRSAMQVAIEENKQHIVRILSEVVAPTPAPVIVSNFEGIRLLDAKNTKRKILEEGHHPDITIPSSKRTHHLKR